MSRQESLEVDGENESFRAKFWENRVKHMEQTGTPINSKEIFSRLGHHDAHVRHQTRLAIISLGEAGLPLLYEGLHSRNWHIRWESVKALGEYDRQHHNPEKVAERMIHLLQDDDHSVRWATMGSLIRMQRAAVGPLLLALTRDFHSSRMREGAHHVLHILYSRNLLTDIEKEVFEALEGSAPGVESAWAANRALMGGCCDEYMKTVK